MSDLVAENQALRDELAAVKGLSNEWVSVDDRLPTNTGQYLVIDKKGTRDVMTYSISWGCFVVVASEVEAVTHWQPLPLPPKESGE